MNARHTDGSAGDANYGAIGGTYSRFRQPDDRIAAFIRDALGHLRRDLSAGTWDSRWGHLRTQPEYDGSLRLIVAN